jgi:hypothetical protein
MTVDTVTAATPSLFDAGLPLPYFDPEYQDDPHRLNRLAREQAPIAMGPLGPEVLAYDLTQTVLRDRRFCMPKGLGLEAQGITSGPLWDRAVQGILSLDGDEHHRLRRLMSKSFTPRAAGQLRTKMVETITELLDPVTATGHCDVVADVARRYPIPIICELLGAPREDWELISAWTDDIFKIFNFNVANDAPDILRAFDELDAYMDTMVADRRRALTDDLISQLIRAEDDGDRLTHDELKMLVRRGGGRPAATSRRPRDGSATCTRSPNPRSTGTASLVRLICGLALQERRHMWQGSKARVRRVIRLAGRRSFRRPSCDYGDSHSTWRLAAFGKPEVIVLLRVLSPARLRSSSAGGAPGGLVWMTWIGGHRSGRAVSVPAWR